MPPSNDEGMLSPLILESQYLPDTACMSALAGQQVYLEAFEHYQKQSARSRTLILTANGVERLTVPVQHGGKILAKEVRIDYSSHWPNQHWRAIMSAYRNAPYFEYMADDFERSLYKRHTFLWDLNLEMLTNCLKFLKIGTQVGQTDTFVLEYGESAKDLRNVFGTKKGGRFQVEYVGYRQVFGENFVPGLSVLDLLFCTGALAAGILRRQQESLTIPD